MSLETSWESVPASAGHKASMSDGYDFSALRILVVDDSFHMRELVRTFLEGFGIKEVTVSSDAEEAYDLVVNLDPDLIITDWNMAPVSGLEFVERIRKGANVPNRFVPIIMLTGYTEMKRVEEARDAGINSFLAKPISAASLYKRLVTSVQDKRQYVESTGGYFGPDRRSTKRREFRGKERRGGA
ncbi:MAG: response regulator [Alphaproteobacteria bacterium]|jgi:CheY-like chemotaxis protein|nr:two-component system response regulator [Magnetovibrio sp.]HBT42273.1 two-component system response regulator [Rhodospirillaceae bacterium]HCS71171.1 two-component system response regulator [Rhodospirillaceae bacterium]|tara:strand:- start:1150 stop:1704 length:555 start_codon:yes stop_codon:yes gene_type:complete